MEGRDSRIAEHLYLQVLWLNVHVRSSRFAAAYLLEHHPEALFKLGPSICTFRHLTWIKHCGIVIECLPELFPIEVIEGTNEMGERLVNLRIHGLRTSKSGCEGKQ